MHILVPVRYPLTDLNERALRRGLDLATRAENPELIVLHVNDVITGRHVAKAELRETVEKFVGPVDASYVVRDAVLVEEAVVNEVVRLEATHVVVNEERKNRWAQIADRVFDRAIDLPGALADVADLEVEVVDGEEN